MRAAKPKSKNVNVVMVGPVKESHLSSSGSVAPARASATPIGIEFDDGMTLVLSEDEAKLLVEALDIALVTGRTTRISGEES